LTCGDEKRTIKVGKGSGILNLQGLEF